MNPRHSVACARCGHTGKQRWIEDLFSRVSIDLCDTCYHALIYAHAPAWKWFREYRDRIKPAG